MKPRLNSLLFDRDNCPSIVRGEGRSQILLTNGVRALIGTLVTKAQYVKSPFVLGHRRETRRILRSLLCVKGVKQPAVEYRLERLPQTLQVKRVGQSELNLDTASFSLLSSDRERRLGDIDTPNCKSHRGYVNGVLAGSTAHVEYRIGKAYT